MCHAIRWFKCKLKPTKIDTVRFTDIDIDFDITYEGYQNWSKILSLDILRVFGDHHM